MILGNSMLVNGKRVNLTVFNVGNGETLHHNEKHVCDLFMFLL
jgi:hypothetical protein